MVSIIYDIIAIGIRCLCMTVPGTSENCFTINNIECIEVTSLARPFFREMATAHLCCGVLPIFLYVCHLSSPFNRWSTIRQDREYGRWPISEVSLRNFQPPVSISFNVLFHCTCHANQFVIFWMINEGVKTNEGEKKWIFLCKTTWTFKFTVLKYKLGKNKLFIEKKN